MASLISRQPRPGSWLVQRGSGAAKGVLAFLLLGLVSCESPPSTLRPLIFVQLNGEKSKVTKVVLKITLNGVSKTQEFTLQEGAPFDALSVGFPAESQGTATFDVEAFDASGCKIFSGTTSQLLPTTEMLASDPKIDVRLDLVAVDKCGAPTAKLLVQLVNGVGGAGKVTGTGINCGGGGSDCEEPFPVGQQVTLTATPSTGNFLGWSGGCTGVGPCSLTLTPSGEFTVQASFGVCQGWCAEPSGVAGTTQVWNAIYGRSAGDIMVVGDNGAITHWDGQSWKAMTSGTTKNLYAVTVPRGSTSYVAVGEDGTIVVYDGTVWKTIPSGTVKHLYGVSGVSADDIRAVGQSATLIKGNLQGFGAGEGLPNNPGTKSMRAIMVQTNNGSSGEFLVVGDSGYAARRYYVGFGYWDDSSPGGTKDLYSAWYSKFRQVVVGQGGVIFRRSYNLGWQGWQTETVPGFTTDLNGVWGASESYILAVGAGGKILRYDGNGWGPLTSGITDALRGVWGTSATNAYAVGAANTIRHFIP